MGLRCFDSYITYTCGRARNETILQTFKTTKSETSTVDTRNESRIVSDKLSSLTDNPPVVTNESVIAKPLEPKPTSINLIVGSEVSDYTDILIGISSTITLGLTLLLITISYKLYQTYQSPVSSPIPTRQSINSIFSLDTTISEMNNTSELPISIHSSETKGSEKLQTKSVAFDLAPENLSVDPIGCSRSSFDPNNFLKQENSDSTEKWHFPRTNGDKQFYESKYMSL